MTTSGPHAQGVLRNKNGLDGRSGFRLRTDWGSVCVLEGGGHICELSLNACSGVNPLWQPPWATMDPFEYTRAKHARKYGPPPDGKLLSGIAGHSLSFDHFGPPSGRNGSGSHHPRRSARIEVEPPEASTVAKAAIAIWPDASRSADQLQQKPNAGRRKSCDLLRRRGGQPEQLRPPHFVE